MVKEAKSHVLSWIRFLQYVSLIFLRRGSVSVDSRIQTFRAKTLLFFLRVNRSISRSWSHGVSTYFLNNFNKNQIFVRRLYRPPPHSPQYLFFRQRAFPHRLIRFRFYSIISRHMWPLVPFHPCRWHMCDTIWIVAISGCRVLLLLCNWPHRDAPVVRVTLGIAAILSREHQHRDTSGVREQHNTFALALRAH